MDWKATLQIEHLPLQFLQPFSIGQEQENWFIEHQNKPTSRLGNTASLDGMGLYFSECGLIPYAMAQNVGHLLGSQTLDSMQLWIKNQIFRGSWCD